MIGHSPREPSKKAWTNLDQPKAVKAESKAIATRTTKTISNNKGETGACFGTQAMHYASSKCFMRSRPQPCRPERAASHTPVARLASLERFCLESPMGHSRHNLERGLRQRPHTTQTDPTRNQVVPWVPFTFTTFWTSSKALRKAPGKSSPRLANNPEACCL